ncbi:unannotated protein [freshwater metagenome]|uniref:Unannotated protein n=1 Tax=freshwater metagenome TaxID=449393 RepID=A0A6J7H163_9ZZZZ
MQALRAISRSHARTWTGCTSGDAPRIARIALTKTSWTTSSARPWSRSIRVA